MLYGVLLQRPDTGSRLRIICLERSQFTTHDERNLRHLGWFVTRSEHFDEKTSYAKFWLDQSP